MISVCYTIYVLSGLGFPILILVERGIKGIERSNGIGKGEIIPLLFWRSIFRLTFSKG